MKGCLYCARMVEFNLLQTNNSIVESPSRWLRLQFANELYELHKLIKATVNINLTCVTHTHAESGAVHVAALIAMLLGWQKQSGQPAAERGWRQAEREAWVG